MRRGRADEMRNRPATTRPPARSAPRIGVAVSILAGGLSTRMGRDKARLRVAGLTLLGHVRKIAEELGLPVRIIRRDLVPRCGPLGGIFTALKTSRAKAELFLACDMPLVRAALLRRVVRLAGSGERPVFTVLNGTAGFPFLIPTSALPAIEAQIRAGQWSLQVLARKLSGLKIALPPRCARELLNINAPDDWRRLRSMLSPPSRRSRAPAAIARKSRLSARRPKVMVRP